MDQRERDRHRDWRLHPDSLSRRNPRAKRFAATQLSQTEIEWFSSRDEVSSRGVGVTGVSKGGELSLLLGATIPAICAVVAHVPSEVTMMGIPDTSRSCWSFGGKALPFTSAEPTAAFSMYQPDGSLAMRKFYLSAIRDRDSVESATIPVERTNGPIMLVSGADDQAWPSFELAEIAVRCLKRSHFPHSYTHLTYPTAGHAIVLPYVSGFNATKVFYPFLKFMMVLGGTLKANADAAADSWPKVIAFFQEHLH